MKNPENCPKCQSVNIYEDFNFWVCPECSYEWSPDKIAAGEKSLLAEVGDAQIRDAFGNILISGDTVSVIKDLKIKGSSSVVKSGTKVKNIRLQPDGDDGHNISCRIDGLGSMNLKSEFVKKI